MMRGLDDALRGPNQIGAKRALALMKLGCRHHRGLS